MQVLNYLFFDGKCEEAIAFYKSALGATDVMVMRFKDNPDPAYPKSPATDELIMHAELKIGETRMMVSDGRCAGTPKFDGFTLSLLVPNPDEAQRLFTAVGEGGQVIQPLTETFFSPAFGMVADKFGVNWMVLVEKK